MKSLFFIFFSVLFFSKANAQSLAINTDGSTANASSILDVKSTDKGVLIPRMSKADKNAIVAPANGLLIYQNAPDSVGFYYYNSSNWIWLQNTSGAGSGWSTTGNSGTDTSVNFMGTRDNKPLQFKINNKKAGLISVDNLGLGHLSLDKLEYGGNNFNNHTAIGNVALTNLRNGILNVGLGTYGLGLLVNGSNNVGIGFQSGSFAMGSDNVIIANAGSLSINEFDSITDNIIIGNHKPTLQLVSDKNVLIGSNAGGNLINGGGNVAVGDSASASNTTGTSNVAIGAKALAFNTTKSNLVAIGDSALYNNGIGANITEAVENTAIGSKALYSNTTGFSNTAMGFHALKNNQASNANVAVGTNALATNISGGGNTALGFQALLSHQSNDFNTAIGANALASDQSGGANVAVGVNALWGNISGIGNNALGNVALQYNRTGNHNTAFGDGTLTNNTIGHENVALGFKASGAQDTAANTNTTIGSHAGRNNKGNSTVLIGTSAGYNNRRSNIVAIGDSALFNNGTGATATQAVRNTAIGSKAMYSNTTGYGNTSTGYNSLKANTTGFNNTAMGDSAMQRLSAGNDNIAIGVNASSQNLNGVRNVAIGNGALYTNFNSNNVAIGYNAGYNEGGSSTLYIENSNADKNNALIYGDFAADSLTLNAKTVVRDNAVIRGYTKLGGYEADVPSIKMKELSGTTGTAASTGAASIIAISLGGVDASKILAVNVLVGVAANVLWIPPSYDSDPRLKYNYFVHTNGNIYIQNSSSDCTSPGDHICNKDVKVIITYKQ
jgi:hypothetical protein